MPPRPVPLVGQHRLVEIRMQVSPDVAHAIATDRASLAGMLQEQQAVILHLMQRLKLIELRLTEEEARQAMALAQRLQRRIDENGTLELKLVELVLDG